MVVLRFLHDEHKHALSPETIFVAIFVVVAKCQPSGQSHSVSIGWQYTNLDLGSLFPTHIGQSLAVGVNTLMYGRDLGNGALDRVSVR